MIDCWASISVMSAYPILQYRLSHLLVFVTLTAVVLSICATLGMFDPPPPPRPPSWEDLRSAIGQADEREADRLIAIGLDLNERDLQGKTLLFYAAQMGRAKIVEKLIKGGADVNAVDSYGQTPLHWVSLSMHSFSPADLRNEREVCDHNQAVRLLIKHGANVNVQDERGFTPLHSAASWSRVEMVRILLAAGARVDIKNRDGKTADDLLRANTGRGLPAPRP